MKRPIAVLVILLSVSGLASLLFSWSPAPAGIHTNPNDRLSFGRTTHPAANPEASVGPDANEEANGVSPADGVARASKAEVAGRSMSSANEISEPEDQKADAFTASATVPLGDATLYEIQSQLAAVTDADTVSAAKADDPQTGAIQGVVTVDGTPVAHSQVGVFDRMNTPLQELRTGEDGSFTFDGLKAAEYAVYARVPRPHVPDSTRGMKRIVIVEAGQVSVADFAFAGATSAVRGNVRVNGVPASEFSVVGWVYNETGEEKFIAVQSPTGDYSAEHIPAGDAKVQVYIETETGLIVRAFRTVLARDQTTQLDIDISNFGTLTGTLNNRPKGRSNVGIVVLPGGIALPDSDDLTPEQFNVLFNQIVSEQQADIQGNFRAEGLEAGEYTVVGFAANGTEASAFREASLVIATVDVEVGADTRIQLTFPTPQD